MPRMFGTDGVRGIANRELTPLLAYQLGRAFASGLLQTGGQGHRIIVGRDTRLSGPMLECALSAGVASTGVDVSLAGVIPTPGLAHLVKQAEASGGAMISASHNPAEDNGIKLFGAGGFKLSDEQEDIIEARVQLLASGADDLPAPVGGGVGRIMDYHDATLLYADHIMNTVDLDLTGSKIVIDCAHGAAVSVAGSIFRRLGARVIELNVEPDGLNINVSCGATNPAGLAEAVLRHKAVVGFAFDGDADRLIAVDERGAIVDGDHILAICGRYLLDRNELPHRTIATTVYSNLGLKETIEAAGGRLITTPAGDRYVLEAMNEHGLHLGGEQSGHIIFLQHGTTGDGLLTALQMLQVMQDRGESLSILASEMRTYPQLLVNVRVRTKIGWDSNKHVAEAIREATLQLEGGRLLVRPSGTEPLIRVMGEARDEKVLQSAVVHVANVIERELG